LRYHLYKLAEAIFPRELAVIDRATELFLSVPRCELIEESDTIVDFYIDCLVIAMGDLEYDNHIRSIHRNFYRWRKVASHLRSLVPRRFRPKCVPKPTITMMREKYAKCTKHSFYLLTTRVQIGGKRIC
jgi:hypothetical protein